MSSDVERQRRLYERRRGTGHAPTTVWVPKERIPEIRRIAQEMRERREYELRTSEKPEERRILATHCTGPDLLVAFSRDTEAAVRAAVAANAFAPPDVLEDLAQDPDPKVRRTAEAALETKR